MSNQPVTQAIIGAKIAAVAAPTSTPKMSWNAMSDVARLVRARLASKTIEPVRTTRRGPKRSAIFPHTMLASAMAMKPIVIAVETPLTDHPVSREIGRRKTGSENMAPIATQPSRPPAATITQR